MQLEEVTELPKSERGPALQARHQKLSVFLRFLRREEEEAAWSSVVFLGFNS